MYATWPIVVSALVAGLVGGFLIPDRPQSRSAVAAKAPVVPEGGQSDAVASPRPANTAPEETHALAATEDRPSAASEPDAVDPQRSPCAIDSWPYRAPGCLDRTAAVEPGYSLVDVKRVDPAQSLVADRNTARDRSAESRQKVVSAPSASSEKTEDTKRADDSSNEATGAAKAESRPKARPERRARPAGRGSADNRFGREDPPVVIRGSDGRLYLAPRYRHVPPPGYYIR